MPRTYKDYLIQRRLRYTSSLFLVGVLILTALYTLIQFYGWSHRFDVTGLLIHIIPALLALFAWCISLKKDWNYKIDANGFSLIRWQQEAIAWEWHRLTWKQDVVFSVSHDEWRGLPALFISTQVKPHKQLQKLIMVYAHEDAEKVRTQVLPLIEQYRRQYRHELWADRLRS